MQESPFDLVILDRMLPHMNGIEVLKEARSRQIKTPVLMLTALGELDDRLAGLNGGADDYMVKPFAFEELLARIQCLLRRPAVYQDSVKFISLADVSFVPKTRTLSSHEKTCTLSSREGELMEVFLRNPGQTLPRQLLLSRVWGLEADVEEGNLDNYIHFLRRRLKAVESTLQIRTVRGVGYQLEVFQ